MTTDAKLDVMVKGYLAGLDSPSNDLPECHYMMPLAFKHGWLNGRDDRIKQPRDRGDVLRRRASMILGEEKT